MDRGLYKRCENVCQIMAAYDYVGNEDWSFIEDLCRENGITGNDMEFYLFEVFGMSSSDIFEAFGNM